MISHFDFTDHEYFSSDLRTRFRIGDGDEPETFRGDDLAVVNSLSTTPAALILITLTVKDSLSMTPVALNLIEVEDEAVSGGMYLGLMNGRWEEVDDNGVGVAFLEASYRAVVVKGFWL
ncbi:unnamed protein product [Lactuca saligna]|uniref:Uncharacterized protein n=1 Tax=Lactuca saligna TaxID=75948 RepID=A0AA35VD81_LACSI|nr:unnamed protein product [Lactuca saligna]